MTSCTYTQAQSSELINDRNWIKSYTNAVGLKIGNVLQINYKHFINTEISIESSSGFYLNNEEGIYSSIMVTYNHDTYIKNLYWFYGAGFAFRNSKLPFEIGMAGSIGFEVVSNDKSLNFFVDIQPTAYYPIRNQFGVSSIVPRMLSELNYFLVASVGARYIISK